MQKLYYNSNLLCGFAITSFLYSIVNLKSIRTISYNTYSRTDRMLHCATQKNLVTLRKNLNLASSCLLHCIELKLIAMRSLIFAQATTKESHRLPNIAHLFNDAGLLCRRVMTDK